VGGCGCGLESDGYTVNISMCNLIRVPKGELFKFRKEEKFLPAVIRFAP
jgi:hypothetical protein